MTHEISLSVLHFQLIRNIVNWFVVAVAFVTNFSVVNLNGQNTMIVVAILIFLFWTHQTKDVPTAGSDSHLVDQQTLANMDWKLNEITGLLLPFLLLLQLLLQCRRRGRCRCSRRRCRPSVSRWLCRIFKTEYVSPRVGVWMTYKHLSSHDHIISCLWEQCKCKSLNNADRAK